MDIMKNQKDMEKLGLKSVYKKGKLSFVLQVVAIFVATFAILFIFGLVPNEFKKNTFSVQKVSKNETVDTPEKRTLPDHISIPTIGVDSQIERPNTPNVDVLDEALKKGAVYYPGSGSIEKGNVFLFGHSTGFKVVNNQAYKTFNNLDKLTKGEEIYIESEGKTYVYTVDTVVLADENTALVNLDTNERKLTLSTCNTFGAKQERWVVEAHFVGMKKA